MNHKTAGILVLTITLILGGCIFAPRGGSGDWDGNVRARPTIGQELLDLDRAREAGVINNAEYERTRARILERE